MMFKKGTALLIIDHLTLTGWKEQENEKGKEKEKFIHFLHDFTRQTKYMYVAQIRDDANRISRGVGSYTCPNHIHGWDRKV